MPSLRTEIDCNPSHFNLDLPEFDAAVPAAGPEHTWVDHLFEDVKVRSKSHGRIRFHLDFKGDEILSDTLRRELHRLPSVKFGSYSERTRTALVLFDPEQVSESDIALALLRGVAEFARLHGECDLNNHKHERKKKTEGSCGQSCSMDCSAPVTDASIRKEFVKLGITGVALGYFLIKRLSASPAAVAAASRPLSLTSFITILSGYPILRGGYKSVTKDRKATDDTLVGMAVMASLVMGESLTGLSVVWLIQLGRILEMVTLKRSRTAVKELMDLTPSEAWLVASTDSVKDSPTTRKVAVEKIQLGQVIRVFHGEKVALDGRIVRGTGLLRESFLTGENVPRQKTIDAQVYAGSVLEAGEIDVEVTSVEHDTVVATMADAIESLRESKAELEKVGTKFATTFIPVSIGLATVTFLVTGDLRRAVTMLVIACPCAAGLATPTAVSAAIGQVAKKGILVKGGTHLETGAQIDTIVFDKTGTLTLGTPILQQFVETAAGKKLGADECLRLAASAEQNTTHPLGRVLVAQANKQRLVLAASTDYEVHEGRGVSAKVDGKTVHVGSRRFMEESAVKIPKTSESSALESFHAGESVLYLSVDRVLQGFYIVEDQVRPDARKMLSRLEELGVKRFLMATGDQKIAAEHIARQLGMSEFHAELLPQDKLALVRKLKAEGRRVAMMGDGVNDAQALAEADLSIAMGSSRCDVAIETADVTIAREDLMLVPELFDVSKKTLRTIYQNFTATVGVNAGGVLYGALGKMSPFSAAIAHNASTLVVLMNSWRLAKRVAGSNPLQVLREVKV